MKVDLINLTSSALTFALVLGIYTASAYKPQAECGPVDRFFEFCGS